MDSPDYNEADLKKKLTPEQFAILRGHGTEPAFSGKLLHNKEKGIYTCPVCGAELFKSDTKFDSGSGWPSFYEAANNDAVTLVPDDSFGMVRTEVNCARCGSHLGHLFHDAPNQPTGDRFCINSASLNFKPSK